jgi:hypothetical protein
MIIASDGPGRPGHAGTRRPSRFARFVSEAGSLSDRRVRKIGLMLTARPKIPEILRWEPTTAEVRYLRGSISARQLSEDHRYYRPVPEVTTFDDPSP